MIPPPPRTKGRASSEKLQDQEMMNASNERKVDGYLLINTRERGVVWKTLWSLIKLLKGDLVLAPCN